VKLEGGLTPLEVVDDVVASSRLPGFEAGFFVGSSIRTFCAQYLPLVQAVLVDGADEAGTAGEPVRINGRQLRDARQRVSPEC
jgi:hypothetical protein